MSEPIAIVGLGCMFPKAPNLRRFWANVRGGVDAITDIPASHFNIEDYYDPDPQAPDKIYARRGGFLEPVRFDPLRWGIAPRDIEATDTTQLLGLMVADAALQDAGYHPGGRTLPRDTTSVILGVTGALELVVPLGARLGHPLWRRALREAGVDPEVAEDVIQRIAEGYVPWQENSFPGLLGNVAAGRIANRLDLHGTNCAVDAACASSLSAVHLGLLELRSGRTDVVLAGGIDTFNDIFMYTCFSKTPALSKSGQARPFDRDGDGTTLGEGVGMVVLKRLDDARRDGDRIYAQLLGVGSSSDGKGTAIYAPSSTGQARALRAAYRDAEVEPTTIGLIEAHGTGTRVGDATEVEGLRAVFGSTDGRAPWCALGSVKSMIGHTKAAAGAAGLIKATLALYHRVLPPTLKVTHPNDALTDDSPLFVNGDARPWVTDGPRRAGVSAFGFGGSNFHAVLQEQDHGDVSWDGDVQIFAWSGTRSQLRDAIGTFDRSLPWADHRRLAAHLRERFRSSDPVRVCMVVDANAPRWDRLDDLEQALTSSTPLPFGVDLAGVFLAGLFLDERPQASVAVVCPGQGAQSLDMLRDLATTFPEFVDGLELAERHAPGLTAAIYPRTAFDEATLAHHRASLQATDVAQPALGAVSWSSWKLLQRFGVPISATAGHSYGELVALAIAGRLTADDLFRLSVARGRHMAHAAGNDDPGTMLAVFASREVVQTWLAESGLDLTIANFNAPEQVVLAGSTPAIAQAQKTLSSRGLRSTPLVVAAAFHTAFVAQAATAFAHDTGGVAMPASGVRVYSNTTTEPYPDDPEPARSLLAHQLANPVQFAPMIERMVADGIDLFVELGPGRRLSGLIQRIAPTVSTVSLDPSEGRRAGLSDLAHLLAELAVRGVPVRLDQWDPASHHPVVSSAKMAIEICGANAKPRPAPLRPPITRRPQPSAATPSSPPNPLAGPSSSAVRDPRVSIPPLANDGAAAKPFEPPPAPPSSSAVSHHHETLAALLRLQEQTTAAHQQFLESQAEATRIIERLLTGSAPMTSSHEPVTSVPSQPSAPATTPSRAGTGQQAEPTTPSPPPVASTPIAVSTPTGSLQTAISRAPTPTGSLPTVASTPASSAREQPETNGSSSNVDAVTQALLQVIADKTGYPPQMLDLEMGLDADLGIDSIKRVEILSALQEALPHAPTIGPDQLSALQTLRQIAQHLGAAEAGPSPIPTEANGRAESPSTETVVLQVVADKTGYPPQMLDLEMGLDADLGIDSIKRVEILSALQEALPHAPTIGPDQLATLGTLRAVAQALSGITPSVTTPVEAPIPSNLEPLVETPSRSESPNGVPNPLDTPSISEPKTEGSQQASSSVEPQAEAFPPILTSSEPLEPLIVREPRWQPITLGSVVQPNGTIYVTQTEDDIATAVAESLSRAGLQVETIDITEVRPFESMAGLVFVAPRKASTMWLQSALIAAREAAPRLSDGLIASVTVLGGQGSVGDATPEQIVGSGIAGLIKTAALEWPQAHARALDLDRIDDELDLAHLLLAQGPVEVGHDGTTKAPALVPVETPTSRPFGFDAEDVVVVSGGARGITASIAQAFAGAGAKAFVLLGRTPLGAEEPAWLQAAHGETAIRRALLEAGDQAAAWFDGQPRTPKWIAAITGRIMAQREIRATLEHLEQHGATARYLVADVRDASSVEQALQACADLGPVTMLVHGAGVIADRLIVDKRDEAIAAVLGTKIDGLEHLLSAIDPSTLRAVLLLSSSTARFGRRGQSDYAMANEVLNKRAHQLQRDRPGIRAIAIGWGPWDGGMVDAGLKALFAEEGIAVIDRALGGTHAITALGQSSLEQVVLGGGSVLPIDPAFESAEPPTRSSESPELAMDIQAPPIDAEQTQAHDRSTHGQNGHHGLNGSASAATNVVLRRYVAVESHRVLSDHVLRGYAVLPVALSVEWLAHAAMHDHPGLPFVGVRDLKVFRGIRLSAHESRRVEVLAGPALALDEGRFAVSVQLQEPEQGPAIGAEVLLGNGWPQAEPQLSAPDGPRLNPYTEGLLFHGPRWQTLEVKAVDSVGLVARCKMSPRPGAWMHNPVRHRWIADPLMIDAGLQAAIVWSQRIQHAPCLPARWGLYRQWAAPGAEPLWLTLMVEDSTPHQMTSTIEWTRADGTLVARLDDFVATVDPALTEAFAQRRLQADRHP